MKTNKARIQHDLEAVSYTHLERLMEYNIPFQMRDALPNIYEHWITPDLLTYIRMAADPPAEQHQAKRADALRSINLSRIHI